ncbi:hypothetical protein ACJJTC_015489 [Scirpophaga incertulas]
MDKRKPPDPPDPGEDFIYSSLATIPLSRCSDIENNLMEKTNRYWQYKDKPLSILSLRKLQNIPSQIVIHNKIPNFTVPYEVLIFKPCIHFDIGINKLSPCANIIFRDAVADRWNEHQKFYTDASKLSTVSRVGISVYFQNSHTFLQYMSPPEASVFTGECIGILEACLFIEAYNIKKSVVFSDSLSALKALHKNVFKCKLNSKILLDIKSCLLNCTLKDSADSL